MTNISITVNCNKHCNYCFSRDFFKRHSPAKPHMSEATYIKALDFLDRSHIDQVRLLGGEPTLHPEFSTFVDLAVNRGKQLLVFSNGLMPKAALARLRQTRPNTATILVNVTDFPRMKHEDRRHLFDVFQNLRSRVMLGYTIESPDVHFEFMLLSSCST